MPCGLVFEKEFALIRSGWEPGWYSAAESAMQAAERQMVLGSIPLAPKCDETCAKRVVISQIRDRRTSVTPRRRTVWGGGEIDPDNVHSPEDALAEALRAAVPRRHRIAGHDWVVRLTLRVQVFCVSYDVEVGISLGFGPDFGEPPDCGEVKTESSFVRAISPRVPSAAAAITLAEMAAHAEVSSRLFALIDAMRCPETCPEIAFITWEGELKSESIPFRHADGSTWYEGHASVPYQHVVRCCPTDAFVVVSGVD